MKLATNGWKEISHQINFIHIGELLTNLAPRVRQDIRRLIFDLVHLGASYNSTLQSKNKVKRRGERLIVASRLTMEDIFQWCFLFVCEIYILF